MGGTLAFVVSVEMAGVFVNVAARYLMEANGAGGTPNKVQFVNVELLSREDMR